MQDLSNQKVCTGTQGWLCSLRHENLELLFNVQTQNNNKEERGGKEVHLYIVRYPNAQSNARSVHIHDGNA